MDLSNLKILVRGAGEMATAVTCRLYQSHLRSAMTETSHPEAVRREVAFCEAVYDREKTVESVTARLIGSPDEIFTTWGSGQIPLIIDPDAAIKTVLKPDVIIDATIAKRNLGNSMSDARLVIGLGVGFSAGRDVHVVVETNRGHNLGRLIREGQAEPDTGVPGVIMGYSAERVLRSPKDGIFSSEYSIGDSIKAGDKVAEVDGTAIHAAINGIIRGLLRNGTRVHRGMKSGDIDPRGKREYCFTISDKGRAIGGAVLEAILSEFNR